MKNRESQFVSERKGCMLSINWTPNAASFFACWLGEWGGEWEGEPGLLLSLAMSYSRCLLWRELADLYPHDSLDLPRD